MQLQHRPRALHRPDHEIKIVRVSCWGRREWDAEVGERCVSSGVGGVDQVGGGGEGGEGGPGGDGSGDVQG
jgi:hypothetical protein